jgi:RNA polymerase sigma-70 factor (ECF subfamily)
MGRSRRAERGAATRARSGERERRDPIEHAGGHDEPAVTFEMVAIDTFERFYRAEYGRMVGLAYQLTGRRDVAEDLVQEAMMHSYREWGRISSYERPDLWLRRAVLNLTTSRWRRQRTAARSWLASGRPVEVPEPSAETVAIWEHVRRLPRRQSEVVALYYGCDLPVDDIAATLDCSPGTVRTHLVRARAALASRLDPSGGEA